jgi:asparagine synthase (glutamine-hydrolysing)
MQFFSYLNQLPERGRQFLKRLSDIFPEQAQKRNLLRKFKRFLKTSSGKFATDYLGLMTLFNDSSKKSLYTAEFAQHLKGCPPADRFIKHLLEEGSSLHWIDRISKTDYESYLPNDLLAKVDIASMAHSLELRSPFLDHKFVEFSASLPPKLKLRGTKTKYLLKRALGKILPRDILSRKKMGFGVPLNHWLRGPLQDFAKETLLSENSLKRNYFIPEKVRQLLSEHAAGRKDQAYKIWSLLVLEIWHQVYIEGANPTTQRREF